MSATLTVRIDQDTRSSATVGHETVITVRQVAELDGRYPDRPLEKAVIAGRQAVDVLVRSGRYRVEARLPGGQVLRESLVLKEDDRQVVAFTAPASAHDWLAWQTASGNVPPNKAYQQRQSEYLSEAESFRALSVGQQPRERPSEMAVIAQFQIAQCSMQGVLARSRVFRQREINADDTSRLWRGTFTERSNLGAERAIALVEAELPGTSDTTLLLAFLPAPWMSGFDEFAKIEILYNAASLDGRQLRVSVVDEKRAALLGYLGASQMREAAVAFEAYRFSKQIHQDMESKRQNPLAAAAAAYVGLGFAVGDERRDAWSPWLKNLMAWFPSIPDGAILRARDILDRASSRDDLTEALKAFVEAYRRGPPYFSMGVRHLLEGLSLFSASSSEYGLDPREMRHMHRTVSEFAMMTDPTQAFTVLKIDPWQFHVRP